MSDVSGQQQQSGASSDNLEDADPTDYVSAVDPAFSEAWNSIMDPDYEEKQAARAAEAGAAAGGDEGGAAGSQGGGAAGSDGTAPAGGAAAADGAAPATGSDTVDAAAAAAAVADAGAGAAADGAAASADAAQSGAESGAGAGESAAAAEGVAYAVVAPQLAQAGEAIRTNAEASFKAQATQELGEQIGPKWNEALRSTPYMLVGTEVPNLRGEGTIQLKDTDDAREWQQAAAALITAEVDSRVASKQQETAQMQSVLQESVLLFQNNPDLVPGTNEFDTELADKFAAMAKEYELRVGDKLYGYQVNVQPLINNLRSDLAKSRGAAGAQQPATQQPTAQQQRAATQARDGQQRFTNPDATQAGIPSKAGSGGAEGEDFSDFWGAVGMNGVNI